MNKDGDKAKIYLRRLSTLLIKRKKKISLKLSAFTIEGKAITPTSVFRRENRSQKTIDSLDNLYADNYS